MGGLYCLGLYEPETPDRAAAASPIIEPAQVVYTAPPVTEIKEAPVPLAAKPQTHAWPIPEDFVRSGGSFPDELQEYAWELCEEYGVPFALVHAMIELESGYRSTVISSGGAVGYMQIIPVYNRDRMASFGYDNVMDAEANLTVGISLIGDLIQKYGDIEQALVVYNTGNAAVKTNGYSRAVVARMMQLEVEHGQGGK